MSIRQLVVVAAPAKKPAAKKAPAKKAAAPKKAEKPKLGKGAEEPTAYFESLERNRKGSMKVMKKQWSKAVKKAEAEGKGKKGPYIMRIFKNLMGISTAGAGGLPGVGNEPSGIGTSPPPIGPLAAETVHPFDAAGLTTAAKPKSHPDDDKPFDYERWQKSGKPQKPGLNNGKLQVKPRKPLKVPKHFR